MNSFLLFLFNIHFHCLVSSSRSSTNASHDEKDALLTQFKWLLSEAYAYGYYQAALDIMTLSPTEEDMFIKTSKEIIRENNIEPVPKDIWKDIISTMASSNKYFLYVLPKHVSVKTMWFLAFVLDSFRIPNKLRDYTDQPEEATWTCLRKLYSYYLGKQISMTPINMDGIIVFLYIHTMNSSHGNSLNSDVKPPSAVTRPLQFHYVQPDTPYFPRLRPPSILPYQVGRFVIDPSVKQVPIPVNSNEQVRVFNIPDMEKDNDATEITQSVDNPNMEEDIIIFEMVANLNDGVLLFEDNDNRYVDIDIYSNRPKTTQQ